MNDQKGFANVILIVVIVAIVAVGGYFVFVKKPEPVAQQPVPTDNTIPVSTGTILIVKLSNSEHIVKVGHEIEARALLKIASTCPFGAPCPPPSESPPLKAVWISSNPNIATVSWKQKPCPPSVPPTNAGCFDFTVAEIKGVSIGTTEIGVTHTPYTSSDSGNKISATVKVTIVPASTASVTVLSPNGGEKLQAGGVFYPSWRIINGSPDIWVGRITLSKSGSFVQDIIAFPSGFQSNTVSARWNIPQDLATGDDYLLNVLLFQGPLDKAMLITTDSSDAPFSIISP